MTPHVLVSMPDNTGANTWAANEKTDEVLGDLPQSMAQSMVSILLFFYPLGTACILPVHNVIVVHQEEPRNHCITVGSDSGS